MTRATCQTGPTSSPALHSDTGPLSLLAVYAVMVKTKPQRKSALHVFIITRIEKEQRMSLNVPVKEIRDVFCALIIQTNCTRDQRCMLYKSSQPRRIIMVSMCSFKKNSMVSLLKSVKRHLLFLPPF